MSGVCKKGGFTLIELVIIILVLSVVAAVAIPKYYSIQGEAQDASARELLNALRGSNTILYTRYVAYGTVTPYTMADLAMQADLQGYTATGSGSTTFSVQIRDRYYTFYLTLPVLPNIPGIVYATTASW